MLKLNKKSSQNKEIKQSSTDNSKCGSIIIEGNVEIKIAKDLKININCENESEGGPGGNSCAGKCTNTGTVDWTNEARRLIMVPRDTYIKFDIKSATKTISCDAGNLCVKTTSYFIEIEAELGVNMGVGETLFTIIGGGDEKCDGDLEILADGCITTEPGGACHSDSGNCTCEGKEPVICNNDDCTDCLILGERVNGDLRYFLAFSCVLASPSPPLPPRPIRIFANSTQTCTFPV